MAPKCKGLDADTTNRFHQGLNKLRHKCYHAQFYQNNYDRENHVTPAYPTWISGLNYDHDD